MRLLAAVARCDQSRLELDRLRSDVDAWLVHRRRRDRRFQYASQLKAIESLIEGAVAGLRHSLDTIELDRSALDVYGECRAFDRRVAWLRRVWQFFREKFDQRDDPSLTDVLAAADEVVWSCYRQVVDQAQVIGIEITGPAPLPYVEAYYSPEIFPADLVPEGLNAEVDVDFAREHLNRLPMPVVRLQPACVSSPWWLVYLGHEVGHHIQYALLKEMQLVGAFRIAIEEAVAATGARPEDAERWGRWSREIFADICSLLFMGQWALWAMAELEVGPASTMTRRRSSYPAPAVRLALLSEAARRLQLDSAGALAGLELDAMIAADARTAADSALVKPVVAAALESAQAVGHTLEELTGFAAGEFSADGAVTRWRDRLVDPVEPLVEPSLGMARVLTSAGIAAWADGDGGAAEVDRERLAARLIELIRRAAPEGTRAAAPAGPDARELGEQLAGLLGSRSPEGPGI